MESPGWARGVVFGVGGCVRVDHERVHTNAMTNKTTVKEPQPENIPINSYWIQNGSRWTFQDPIVKKWVESKLQGAVLNACCGQTQLEYPEKIIRNDTNPDIPADYHVNVRDLGSVIERSSVDTIVFDPPWSEYQSNEKYNGRNTHSMSVITDVLNELLVPGGQVISFGYTTTVMPDNLGYEIQEIGVFRVAGWNKDFYGVVDKRVYGKL